MSDEFPTTPEEVQKAMENLVDPDEGRPKDHYKWDQEFQREILALLLSDRTFLLSGMSLIRPEYFSNEIHERICNVLYKHFDKYSEIPTKSQLSVELREKVEDKSAEVIAFNMGELNATLGYYTPGKKSREYYQDKVLNFAKIQALKIAFHKCLEQVNKDGESDKTWDLVGSELQQALLVEKRFEPGLDYFGTVEERYARMRLEQESGDCFTSGFNSIDTALMGDGLHRGEMGSWVGLSGTGKSLALVASALANMHRGMKVLYISLEMDEDSVAERFDAQLADPSNDHGVTVNNLLEKENIVVEALREYVSDKEEEKLLVVKQFPGGQFGVAELKSYYAQMVLHGFQPDLIIIDYIGEMKDYPGIPTHESRYRITRDLRGFAVEEQVCVLTAMQPNKSAKEVIRNFDVIDDENLADSYAQIKPLDAMWSINQHQDEKNCGLARIYVAKHRHGKSRFIFHVKFDYDKLSITEISKDKYTETWKKYQQMKEVTDSDKIREEFQEKQALEIIEGKKDDKKLADFSNDVGYNNEDADEPETDQEFIDSLDVEKK